MGTGGGVCGRARRGWKPSVDSRRLRKDLVLLRPSLAFFESRLLKAAWASERGGDGAIEDVATLQRDAQGALEC